MVKVLKSLLSISLVLFFYIIFSGEARAEVGAPKIIKLAAEDSISLAGLAPASSEVLIYLDGSFIGQTETGALVKTELDCSAPTTPETDCQIGWQWQYDLPQKLADGTHIIVAVTKDKTSLVLSAPTGEIKFTIKAVPAPTLIAPDEKTVTADLRPLIIGLTKDNTLVKVFIDNVFNGQTEILRNPSGTANFAHRPAQNLNRGFHTFWVRAENAFGQPSAESRTLNFIIELPFPPPIILKPVVNRDATLSRPFIVGLAKNDSKIKVYIDKKYNGELTVKNHPSGTANFAYRPTAALARGGHTVYAIAVDKRGKESLWSNVMNFFVKDSAIAESVQEERKGVVANIKEPKEPNEIGSEPMTISSSSGAVVERGEKLPAEPARTETDTSAKVLADLLKDKQTSLDQARKDARSAKISPEEKQKTIRQALADEEKAVLEKIKSLIGGGTENLASDKGLVNEGEQNQAKLKLSIIIFILFLVGVVVWLLWVNRELVKERRARDEAREPSDAKALEDKKAKKNIDDQPSGGQENRLF